MNEIIQQKYGSFTKDIKKLSYTFNENQLFSLNQYKICNNQSQNVFIKSKKIQQNGKVRILYYIEEYEELFDIVKRVSESDYYKICENFIQAIMQVADNGFLDMCNLIIKSDMIYVEKEALELKLLYIPVINDFERTIDMSDAIKSILLEITDKKLYQELFYIIENSDLVQIQAWLKEKRNRKEVEESPCHSLDNEESVLNNNPEAKNLERQYKKSGKVIVMACAIVLLGIVGISCIAGGGLRTNAVMSPTPEPTVTPTPKPTATPTPEPTATPTPTLTPIPEPTATPKPKPKRQVVEDTPIPEQQVPNNAAPQQAQQNPATSETQNNESEEDVEEIYGDYDEIIIIQ